MTVDGELEEHDSGKHFGNHPSIKAILMNNGLNQEKNRLSFHLTNKTQIEELLSNINVRNVCVHDILPRA